MKKIDKQHIVAVVPIKLNNERLPGKNTKYLGNKPLIKYILNTLEKVEGLDSIYVYCSDEKICDYIDGKVKFLKRDKKLDEKSANFTQIFESFAEEVDSDIYVYTHATAPFLTKETIEKAIYAVESGEYDSAFTAEKIQDFIWSEGNPLNFDAKNVPRSQELPIFYRETSGAYVFQKEVFEKHKQRIGKNPKIIEVPQKEMIDINYLEDFQMAEKMLDYKDWQRFPKRLNILDCTLRDGGCANNFDFGNIAMAQIKEAIENSNAEMIELGYINDKKGSSKERTQFLNFEAVNEFLSYKKENTKYLAMIDYGTYDFDNLPVRVQNGIDGIRLAFHKKDYSKIANLAKRIIEKGYEVFIQPMLILTYSESEIIDLIKQINHEVPDITAFYIVDSFGQMQFNDCTRILKIVDQYLYKNIKIGFHGHNNLQLAYSNALEIISNDIAREVIIDCSLNGMGKGAGNVPTELIMNHLNNKYNKNYNLLPVYKIINDVISDFSKEYSWGYSVNFLLTALNKCTPSYVNYFINKCHLKSSDLPALFKMIDDDKKISFHEDHAHDIYLSYIGKKHD